jgi:hypothetical protein
MGVGAVSGPHRLNLPAIEATLRAVQAEFARIDRTEGVPNDPMTDEVLGNMLGGYRLVDDMIAAGVDLFALGNSKWLLELNTMVLCGTDESRRRDYAEHIAATERHFFGEDGEGIGSLIEWLERHRQVDVWQRAAGVFIHVLRRPQLFIEGNDRTGVLIACYVLAREGQPPFVLSPDDVTGYLDAVARIKAFKRNTLGMLFRLPTLERRLASFLRESADPRYLLRAHGAGTNPLA